MNQNFFGVKSYVYKKWGKKISSCFGLQAKINNKYMVFHFIIISYFWNVLFSAEEVSRGESYILVKQFTRLTCQHVCVILRKVFQFILFLSLFKQKLGSISPSKQFLFSLPYYIWANKEIFWFQHPITVRLTVDWLLFWPQCQVYCQVFNV